MPHDGKAATGKFVEGDPYPWPYNGDLRPENTALIIIDMQTDFCGQGGYVDKMGYDLSLTRAPIEPIRRVLAALRARWSSTSSTPARAIGPTWPTCRKQALALAPHRRRHRRSGPLRAHPGARRAGLGDHPRPCAAARRGRDRQAGQGEFLRHRPRADAALAGIQNSC